MCRSAAQGGRRCSGSKSGSSSRSSAGGQRASRRIDGKPETEADKRFFDLRQSGYTGAIDQDGCATNEHADIFAALRAAS
jgi:hypothetical protein